MLGCHAYAYSCWLDINSSLEYHGATCFSEEAPYQTTHLEEYDGIVNWQGIYHDALIMEFL